MADSKFDRDLVRGSLDLMVLSVLADDGRNYGYEIQRRVREASGERVKLPAGTLYPLLHRLEAAGLILSQWDDSTGRRRKFYKLSAAGRRRLKSDADAWLAHVRCVRLLLSSVVDLDGPGGEPASA
ncbi:MAG: PadR family transcriptional regulator [Phycisphaera sp.]|nr:PadR family transcriptional regulator [Phycisphaera sp.]